MQCVNDSSVTVTLDQTASITSSLVTTRPAFSTRYRSTSKALGRRDTSPDGPRSRSRARSSVKPSNWKDVDLIAWLEWRRPQVGSFQANLSQTSGDFHDSGRRAMVQEHSHLAQQSLFFN